MAGKIIGDLQLISSIQDTVNVPVDNGIQSYRGTALQFKQYILSNDVIQTAMIAANQVTLAKLAAAVQEALTPSGSVLAFAGSSAPSGYLLCNGSAVSRSTYAALFAVIGITHGQGDGSTTFNLPDYRGRFLRGVDGGIARDPNRATRTAMNTGGNTADNVGSVQTDAFQGHYHSVGDGSRGITPASGGVVAGNTNTPAAAPGQTNFVFAGGIITDGTNGTPRISSESRPLNAGVNFIIKA